MDKVQKSPLTKHVPESRLSQAAFSLAFDSLPSSILNHSLRVYLFAKWLAAREESSYATEGLDSLFIASIFHDFGATEAHNHSERFEICGADAAVRFLQEAEVQHRSDTKELPASQQPQGLDERQAWDIWTAIALHTSPGIAERIHPLARLVRLGVMIDFRKATREKLQADSYGIQVESDIPRLDIEKQLADSVVKQAMSKPAGAARNEKAPAASWAGVLLRSHLENPGWEGVNRAF